MREPSLKEKIYFTNLELEAMGRKIGRIRDQFCPFQAPEGSKRPIFHVEREDGAPNHSEEIRTALAGAVALMEQAVDQLDAVLENL